MNPWLPRTRSLRLQVSPDSPISLAVSYICVVNESCRQSTTSIGLTRNSFWEKPLVIFTSRGISLALHSASGLTGSLFFVGEVDFRGEARVEPAVVVRRAGVDGVLMLDEYESTRISRMDETYATALGRLLRASRSFPGDCSSVVSFLITI